jgi:glycosyltransferase involved in cell wall biosynthesis
MSSPPLVSVGVPVWNGGKYLRQTFLSILGQSVSDLELIISDNASTDETESICREVAASDPRVKYVRQRENMGGPANWNFVFSMAEGRFFKWATANDICDREFLRRCLEALCGDEELVLAYPRTAFIDGAGQVVGKYEKDPDVSDPDPCERFRRLVLRTGLNNAQQGLVRASALRSTRLERSYESGDLPLMTELALQGPWKLIPEHLLLRRMAPETTVLEMSVRQRRRTYFTGESRFYLPYLRPYMGQWGVILRSRLRARQKFRLAYTLLRALSWNRWIALKEIGSLITLRAFAERRPKTRSRGDTNGPRTPA